MTAEILQSSQISETTKPSRKNLMPYPSTTHVTVTETCFIDYTFFSVFRHTGRDIAQHEAANSPSRDAAQTQCELNQHCEPLFSNRPHGHGDSTTDARMNDNTHTGQAVLTARGMFVFTATILPTILNTHTHSHTHAIPFSLTLRG